MTIMSDEEIVAISRRSIFKRLRELLPSKIPPLTAVILIGSSVQPATRRTHSDFDLVFVVDNEPKCDDENIKINFQTRHSLDGTGSHWFDIKVYTEKGFRLEMLFGSLTRLFAVLNAYKILWQQSNVAGNILVQGEARMQACIREACDQLAAIDIEKERIVISNYFTEALSALNSEKIRHNTILVQLRFFEFLKQFIVQFQRILFALKIQNGHHQEGSLDEYLKNLLVFNNWDGTRLLDENKYPIEPRVFQLMKKINHVLSGRLNWHQKIQKVFSILDYYFHKHSGRPLLISFDQSYEFLCKQNLQLHDA